MDRYVTYYIVLLTLAMSIRVLALSFRVRCWTFTLRKLYICNNTVNSSNLFLKVKNAKREKCVKICTRWRRQRQLNFRSITYANSWLNSAATWRTKEAPRCPDLFVLVWSVGGRLWTVIQALLGSIHTLSSMILKNFSKMVSPDVGF